MLYLLKIGCLAAGLVGVSFCGWLYVAICWILAIVSFVVLNSKDPKLELTEPRAYLVDYAFFFAELIALVVFGWWITACAVIIFIIAFISKDKYTQSKLLK